MSETPTSEFEGTARVQSLRQVAPSGPAPSQSPSQPPAQQIGAVLLTDKQAAALWGIGLTLFHQLRSTGAEWFPRAIQLSPKVVRYVRTEVEAAALSMPRQVKAGEPERLRRGRIERLKRGSVSSATGS